MSGMAPCRIMAACGLAVLLSACAVFDPMPTPGTRRTGDAPAALCPTTTGSTEFAGGADAAIQCLDAWRAAYYGAIREHTQFRATQELLIGALSAKALYEGVTGSGNGHHIAALGAGTALLYGNLVRRSPNQKLAVYAAGMQALSCAAIRSRPLLMTSDEFSGFSALVDAQATQLGVLSGALSLQAGANHLDARNTLSQMQVDLDKAVRLRDRVAMSGAEITGQVGRIVSNVTEQLRRTEPDPATITAMVGSYRALAGTFAHGYLPAAGASEASLDGGVRRGEAAPGARTDHPTTITCPILAQAKGGAILSASAGSTSVDEALYCAHIGAHRLRVHLAASSAIGEVADNIEGCGTAEQLRDNAGPAISLDPDVNRIDLATGGSYTLGIRSAGGIPGVQLYGNASGALEPLKIDASLGYLVVQIKATEVPTPSPVTLAITAPNGDTRHVQIVVSKAADAKPAPAPAAKARGNLLAGEDALAVGTRVRELQCALGFSRADADNILGPMTRARIRKANAVLGLDKHADRWSQALDDLLSAGTQSCGSGVADDQFEGWLRSTYPQARRGN